MKNIWIAVLCVLTFGLMSSCKEEQTLYGNRFAFLNISVQDTSGENAVFQWDETSEDMKETTAEVIESRLNPSHYSEVVTCAWPRDPEKAYFQFGIVIDLFRIGDSATWKFKMYPDDEEEILFEGKCVKNKGKYDTEMLWSFRGVELSIENPKKVTLIRTEDGRYTLKQ